MKRFEISPDAAERLDSFVREHDERQRQRQRITRRENFVAKRGARYADCTIENFSATCDEQREVVKQLTAFRDAVADHVGRGDGLVVFGPRGSGKDHLVVAIAMEAIELEIDVRWINGLEFYGTVRDSMDSDRTESSIIAELVTPRVLYISDPLPPVGKLTDFQAGMLFRVLDGRYNHRRPTWVTVNVASGHELDDRLGPQNGDRLRDQSLAVFCNWSSYRKPL